MQNEKIDLVKLAVVATPSLPWVVIENPGMENETVVDEFSTFDKATCFVGGRKNFDIVKRIDGSLTTEF